MSRSFKRTPGFCDRNPFNKGKANRRVRKDWAVPSGGAYRKVFETWDICDFRFLFFSEREVGKFYSDKPWKPWMK
jgi:hypothetical protein